MRTTKILPVPGLRGWIKSKPAYPTPPDLPHNTPVEIIAKNSGTCELVVREASGQEWTISHWQIDVGVHVEALNGEMVPEWEPAAWDAIDHELSQDTITTPGHQGRRRLKVSHAARLKAIKVRGIATAAELKKAI